jgi:hypothetical protein
MTIEELEQKVLSKYGDTGMAAVCFAARMLEEQSYDGFDCVDKIQELSYLSNEYCNEDEECYDEDEEF